MAELSTIQSYPDKRDVAPAISAWLEGYFQRPEKKAGEKDKDYDLRLDASLKIATLQTAMGFSLAGQEYAFLLFKEIVQKQYHRLLDGVENGKDDLQRVRIFLDHMQFESVVDKGTISHLTTLIGVVMPELKRYGFDVSDTVIDEIRGPGRPQLTARLRAVKEAVTYALKNDLMNRDIAKRVSEILHDKKMGFEEAAGILNGELNLKTSKVWRKEPVMCSWDDDIDITPEKRAVLQLEVPEGISHSDFRDAIEKVLEKGVKINETIYEVIPRFKV